MKNIAVIGAGTMGNGIAHTFAQSGYKVQLIDVNEDAQNVDWKLLLRIWAEWLLKKKLLKPRKMKL